MGPPSYVRSVVDRNVVMWRIPVVSVVFCLSRAAFLKLWSADHNWSSGSALVVLLD